MFNQILDTRLSNSNHPKEWDGPKAKSPRQRKIIVFCTLENDVLTSHISVSLSVGIPFSSELLHWLPHSRQFLTKVEAFFVFGMKVIKCSTTLWDFEYLRYRKQVYCSVQKNGEICRNIITPSFAYKPFFLIISVIVVYKGESHGQVSLKIYLSESNSTSPGQLGVGFGKQNKILLVK